MRGVLVAARAELRHLHAIRIVTAVLLGDVVALLALGAGERDLRANVAGLLGHLSYFRAVWSVRSRVSPVCFGSGGGNRTRDTAIMSRLLYP